MSESILKAIIKLFALIAKIDIVENESRTLVENFLREQLNEDAANEYLSLYDEIIANDGDIIDAIKKKKRNTLSGVKVIGICEQLNKELTQRQKVIVVNWLIEMIFRKAQVNEDERDFMDTVASSFNIQEEEYLRCIIFYNAQENDQISEPEFMLNISSKESNDLHFKQLKIDGLSGCIRILQIKSVNMYLMKYFGSTEISLKGQQIQSNKVYILNQGVSIRSSKFAPIFYSDIVSCFLIEENQENFTFEAQNISYKFKNGKIGLHSLQLFENSGKLIGIMGGSGAGKSTLLNILNGNENPSEGKVLINGINYHQNKSLLRGIVGHISQDDLLMESLSVYENLYFNAKLCFNDLSDEEIKTKTENLLNDIGLYEAKDLKVGNVLSKTISGGQRKRLNIALELIREPSILFVDEPTSGLSSRDSENIMDLLKELALKGKLVFVVIHQPSSDIFKMFDKLLLLDVGGYPIYYGNPVESILYFKRISNYINAEESECSHCGNVNPEQLFNIIESEVLDEYGNSTQKRKISPKQWNKQYVQHEKIGQHDTTNNTLQNNFTVPTRIKQLLVFLMRDILSKWSNTQYMLVNLLEAPVLACILALIIRYFKEKDSGYIFSQNMNMPAYIFMSVIVALFLGMSVSAEEIIADRKIRKRESFLNLSKSSYLISKVAIMFGFSAVQSLLFVLVGNSILGIQDMFLDYWFILFSVSCFANLLGLNISATFNTAVTIYILIPFLLIPQLLLSGVIVKFENLNPTIASKKEVPWVGKVMTSYWAFEALMVNQFKNNAFEKYYYEVDQRLSQSNYISSYWLDEMRSMIEECADGKNQNDRQLVKNILILQNEIAKQEKATSIDFIGEITASGWNESIKNKVLAYVSQVEGYYKNQYLKASSEKDKITKMLAPTSEAIASYKTWKQKNINEAVDAMVRNNLQEERILRDEESLIQVSDNIFFSEPNETILSSHLYAPFKKMGASKLDTFWANALVIWTMTFLLCITLYWNVFAHMIKTAGKALGIIGSSKPKKYV